MDDFFALALKGASATALLAGSAWIAVSAYERGSRSRQTNSVNGAARDRQVRFEALAISALERAEVALEKIAENTGRLPEVLERLDERLEAHDEATEEARREVREIHGVIVRRGGIRGPPPT